MPGVICSLDDLSRELESFIWVHGLSDDFDQQLRYSVPADLCHKFIRDCRYVSAHKPRNERMERFLHDELIHRKGSVCDDNDDETPPVIGALQWLMETTRKQPFHILCNLSVGHTNILVTEFCRKVRLPSSASERLGQAVPYDAVPHEIYAKMKQLSGQAALPRPCPDIPEAGPSSIVEVCERTNRESLARPDVTTPLRPFSLTPRMVGMSRSRSPRDSIEVRRRGYGKLPQRGSHSSEAAANKCRISRGRPRRSEIPSPEEDCVNDGEPSGGAACRPSLSVRVKSESPVGAPKEPWWKQLNTFRNPRVHSGRS